MYAEEDLLPLSLLAQFAFCERRAALVYLEQLWDDNAFTAEGNVLHENAHRAGTEVRGGTRITRGLQLRSLRLGLLGKADVVEFRPVDLASPEATSPSSIRLSRLEGLWQAFPVEYKRGRRRHEEGYELQLCAQAICLEEMLGGAVASGALYYAETGRRLDVLFDASLRKRAEAAAIRLHDLLDRRETPPGRFEKKCLSCSLLNLCLPRAIGVSRSTRRYIKQAFERTIGPEAT